MQPDSTQILAFCAAFLTVVAIGALVAMFAYKSNRRAVDRIREDAEDDATVDPTDSLITDLASAYLPKLGTLLMPRRAQPLQAMRTRFRRAGFYNSRVMLTYLGVQFLLMIFLPVAAAIVAWCIDWPMWKIIAAGVAGLCCAFLGPRYWLHAVQQRRRRILRKSFPDALDMLGLCVEGGVSLMGAIQRVSSELHIAHPLLAGEINIVQREIEMGRSIGDSVTHFAERTGLEEARHLASLLVQSDRYGAGIAGALRTAVDDLRTQRRQEAEEMAQRAAVKILFPMLFCIFPTIFIVLLGPAAIQISRMFATMNN